MTTSEESSTSLISALSSARIPVENHEFIRRFTSAIGIRNFRAVISEDKPHVVASRLDGLPDLRIYYGYTTGFSSDEEIVEAIGGGADRGPSSRNGFWYVAHPTNQVYSGAERAKDKRREGAFCSCGMQLSVTGVCASCE